MKDRKDIRFGSKTQKDPDGSGRKSHDGSS